MLVLTFGSQNNALVRDSADALGVWSTLKTCLAALLQLLVRLGVTNKVNALTLLVLTLLRIQHFLALGYLLVVAALREVSIH